MRALNFYMLQAHNPIYVWVPEGSVLVKHATIDTLLSSYNQERMRMREYEMG